MKKKIERIYFDVTPTLGDVKEIILNSGNYNYLSTSVRINLSRRSWRDNRLFISFNVNFRNISLTRKEMNAQNEILTFNKVKQNYSINVTSLLEKYDLCVSRVVADHKLQLERDERNAKKEEILAKKGLLLQDRFQVAMANLPTQIISLALKKLRLVLILGMVIDYPYPLILTVIRKIWITTQRLYL